MKILFTVPESIMKSNKISRLWQKRLKKICTIKKLILTLSSQNRRDSFSDD